MKVSDVEREHIIRCKEIAKASFEWCLKSYLNRNIPNWGEEITPEGMHISPHKLSDPTIEGFNDAVQKFAGAFIMGFCESLSSTSEDIGRKIKYNGHNFTYQRIVERSNSTITVLYECTECALWRLEENQVILEIKSKK